MYGWPASENPFKYTYQLDLVEHNSDTLLTIVRDLMDRSDVNVVCIEHSLVFFAHNDGPDDIYQTLGYDKDLVNIALDHPPITNN